MVGNICTEVPTCHRILLSSKNKWTIYTHNKLDDSPRNYDVQKHKQKSNKQTKKIPQKVAYSVNVLT